MLPLRIYPTGTFSGIVMSKHRNISPYYLLVLLIVQSVTYAGSESTQTDDDLREYLGRVDEKVRTLMSIVAPERSVPPLPQKLHKGRKDLPNVHPWRSIDDSSFAEEEEWQERLLARHQQQKQQRSSSDYSNDRQILSMISREVDKITVLVKSLSRSSNRPAASGGRASRYSQVHSSQPNGFDDDIVEPEEPWRDQVDRSELRRDELRFLLRDLERTLKVVEKYQSDNTPAQKDEDASASSDSTSTEDQGELELMKLLEENSQQGAEAEKDESKASKEDKQATTAAQTTQVKDTPQKAATPQTHSSSNEKKEESKNLQGPENKEEIRKTLGRLMTDMKDLENQVSSTRSRSQAQQLHDRILQLAEKLGNPPR